MIPITTTKDMTESMKSGVPKEALSTGKEEEEKEGKKSSLTSTVNPDLQTVLPGLLSLNDVVIQKQQSTNSRKTARESCTVD